MQSFENLVETTFAHWPQYKRDRLVRSIRSAIDAIDVPQAMQWKPAASVIRMKQNAQLSDFQAVSVLSTLLAEFWRNGEGPAHDACGRMLHALEKDAERRTAA